MCVFEDVYEVEHIPHKMNVCSGIQDWNCVLFSRLMLISVFGVVNQYTIFSKMENNFSQYDWRLKIN